MVTPSPLNHTWTADEIAELVNYAPDSKALKEASFALKVMSDQNHGSFVIALLHMHLNNDGVIWEDRFNGAFSQAILRLCQATEETDVEYGETDWSVLWLALTPRGAGGFGDCPSCARTALQRHPSCGTASSFLFFDIGHLYRSMADFLALKAVGI